ncbi:MAG: VRR-NUC domain-containing protein [Rhodospirillales bacterium]|nr:VRR-NUC domain-containing protein [Rhodospirillales bacterium]
MQQAVVNYLHLLENRRHLVFFHPENGGYRTPAEAGIGRAMGRRAGVADLIVILPGGRVGALELKSDKGRQSLAQKEWQGAVEAFGVPYAVCRSLDEVRAALCGWGVAAP